MRARWNPSPKGNSHAINRKDIYVENTFHVCGVSHVGIPPRCECGHRSIHQLSRIIPSRHDRSDPGVWDSDVPTAFGDGIVVLPGARERTGNPDVSVSLR